MSPMQYHSYINMTLSFTVTWMDLENDVKQTRHRKRSQSYMGSKNSVLQKEENRHWAGDAEFSEGRQEEIGQ